MENTGVLNVLVPLAAIVGSLVTGFGSWWVSKRSRDDGWSESQRDRIADLERQLEVCARQRQDLRDENLELLRQLLKVYGQ